MRATLKLRTVAAVVLALLVSGCSFNGVYDLPLPGNKVSKGDGFRVSADFADALNVVPRSAVMVGDVPVGQVETVTRVGWHARVTMRIRKNVVLPDNAEALIRQTSLLGEKYVELSPPKANAESGQKPAGTGRLGAGDVIPMANTGRNPEVEEVLGALSLLLSGGGIGQLHTISQELNQMMDGRTGKIRDVLSQLNILVKTLNSQRGDIVQALDSINGLSKTLVTEKDTIGKALDAAGPAITVLRKQHGQLVRMLSELDKLGTVGSRVVNETKDDLVAELRHLEPALRSLADTGNALVPGLASALSYPFPIDAANTIHGDFANVVFKMQIKLTPVNEGGLLPTTLPDLVQLCRATPAAPICSPLGDAVGQLCAVLASLPLCSEGPNVINDILNGGKAPAGASSAAPKNPVSSLLPQTSGSPSTGGAGPGGTLVDKLRGLLGGGGS